MRYLLDSVKEGSVEVEKNDFVSELYYDQSLSIYNDAVDFSIPLQGATQLTNLATNRGRGMIDSNPEYAIEQVLQNRIKKDAAAETELRKTERVRIAKERADKVAQDLAVGNMRSCGDIACLNITSMNKGQNVHSNAEIGVMNLQNFVAHTTSSCVDSV